MQYKQILSRVAKGCDLSEIEAFDILTAIFEGNLTEEQIASLLTAWASKGECVAEICGGAQAMRAVAARVQSLAPDTLDTVGTGGDGGMTFNISTTVAFVAAAAGATVAKHGNRASSGKSGSADCLEALGFNLEVAPEVMEEALNELGIAFLFAPAFHRAMRQVAAVRRSLGIRTIFNLLGPLTNPAAAPCQLIGVFAPHLTETFASVLQRLGSRRVLVVHGHDGMDEITLSAPTRCSELREGRIKTYDIEPSLYFEECAPEDLNGGDAQVNAQITRQILAGQLHGPKRDIVVLNSAAALMAANRATDLPDGIRQSQAALDCGAALEKLERLIEYSKEV